MAGVTERPVVRGLAAGLIAGAVGALIASAVSLPLHSPDDVFFNTATVTIAALLAARPLGYCGGY